MVNIPVEVMLVMYVAHAALKVVVCPVYCFAMGQSSGICIEAAVG